MFVSLYQPNKPCLLIDKSSEPRQNKQFKQQHPSPQKSLFVIYTFFIFSYVIHFTRLQSLYSYFTTKYYFGLN